jgi:[acyl-carrier-protein] S-malonyltransferase
MLAELAELHPVIQDTFVEASDGAGVDLWALSQGGPEEMLNRTEYTQPALLAAGVAVWRAWQQQGGTTPSLFAGHSLGEYSALVAAGALSLHDGAHLVRLRGQLMQEASPAYLERFMTYVDALLWLDQAQGHPLPPPRDAARVEAPKRSSRAKRG